jgi:hypothetical protein
MKIARSRVVEDTDPWVQTCIYAFVSSCLTVEIVVEEIVVVVVVVVVLVEVVTVLIT